MLVPKMLGHKGAGDGYARMGPGNSQAASEAGSGDPGRKAPLQRRHRDGRNRDKEEISGWDVNPWNRPGPWNEKTKRKESRFLIQLFCSFLLLTFTYLIFQSDTAAGRKAQDFVAQVMERDFNFAGVCRMV